MTEVSSIKRIDDVDPNQFEVGEDHVLKAVHAIYHVTKVITSAAAATAVELLPNSKVPAGKKAYLINFIARVDGTTVWGTTANVKIQDKSASAVDFVTMAVAALTSQARVVPGSSNTTLENAFSKGSGGGDGKGLQLKGDANGTGSDLYVTATIVVK